MEKNKILFLFCISITLALSSCSDETVIDGVGEEVQPEAIELAKKWYKSTVTTKSSRSSSDQLIYEEPSWTYFAEQSTASQIVLDIDVTDRIKQDFILENSAERYKETGNYDFRRSYTRLVYKRDVKTGKEIGFFMTIVPSPYYTRTYRQRIEKRNTYLSRDKYLGGYVLYHNLNGEFVNGWKYKSGKVIAKVRKSQTGLTKSNSEASRVKIMKIPAAYKVEANLYVPNRTRSWEDDGSWWFDDVVVYPDPDPWEPDGWDHGGYYDEYEEIDPGPGDGWYDDWGHYPNDGIDPDDNKGYIPGKNDKLAQENIPNTIDPQIGNTCVPSTIAFVNNIFGGTMTLGDVILSAFHLAGTDIIQSGMTLEETLALAISFFNGKDFENMTSAIDAGAVVMVGMNNTGDENDGHNIVVVGYCENGDYIYMDPQEGILKTEDESYFTNSIYTFSIIGNK